MGGYEDFATVGPQWIHHIPGIPETSTRIMFNAFKLGVTENGGSEQQRRTSVCDGGPGVKGG
jgi:hypothetical protein